MNGFYVDVNFSLPGRLFIIINTNRLEESFFAGMLRADTVEELVLLHSQEKQPHHGTHPGPRCSVTLEELTSLLSLSVPEIETEPVPTCVDYSPVLETDAEADSP